MKILKPKQETQSKGVWQIIIAIIPLLGTGLIMGSSSSEGGAMIGAFLLAIFTIPCLIIFVLGIKNLFGDKKKETVIENSSIIENRWIILSNKILSWMTLITFGPLLFSSIDINFNSICVLLSLGLSLYIIVFGVKKRYTIILLILIIIYGYIFYEMYQAGGLSLNPYASWNKPY